VLTDQGFLLMFFDGTKRGTFEFQIPVVMNSARVSFRTPPLPSTPYESERKWERGQEAYLTGDDLETLPIGPWSQVLDGLLPLGSCTVALGEDPKLTEVMPTQGAIVHLRGKWTMSDLTEDNGEGARSAYLLASQALQRAVEETLGGAWRSLEEHGFERNMGTTEVMYAGKLEGHHVVIRRFFREGWRTECVVSMKTMPGLLLTHQDDAPIGESISVNNPLVDRLIHIESDDREGIYDLFQDMTFVDAVLPLVHGHPGSKVTEKGVFLDLDSDMNGPNLPIEPLKTLIRMLKKARRERLDELNEDEDSPARPGHLEIKQ